MEVQLSSTNDVLVSDVNSDTYSDLVIVGNRGPVPGSVWAIGLQPGLVLINDKV
ncbi:MAG: hypothetical protein IPL08_06940 [Saprospiraceae bacterium]|nr:hypothetical protein [Saprospiraceae bacterium]